MLTAFPDGALVLDLDGLMGLEVGDSCDGGEAAATLGKADWVSVVLVCCWIA